MAQHQQLKKYEQNFGEIKSRARAQELIGLARKSLEERKEEFLKAMRERLKKKRKGNDKVRFVIRSTNGKEIAFVNLSVDLANKVLDLDEISTGELDASGPKLKFKNEDSLRGLGLGAMMLNRIKQYARARNLKTIVLRCHEDRISFYKKSGFDDKGPLFSGAFYHTMYYTIHQ